MCLCLGQNSEPVSPSAEAGTEPVSLTVCLCLGQNGEQVAPSAGAGTEPASDCVFVSGSER